jgi:phosphoribosylglycinamide formyltransferase 1
LITAQLDAGPLLAQAAFKVSLADTAESLAKKTHELEHQMYPQLLRLLSLNRGVRISTL